MRYLPVFLDLQSGLVALIGQANWRRAKLRVLVAAGARIRWYATDGEHDLQGLEPAQLARIELAKGDPLADDLTGVVAIFCAGAGDVGLRCRRREIGRSPRQRDGRPRAFDLHLSRHRRPR